MIILIYYGCGMKCTKRALFIFATCSWSVYEVTVNNLHGKVGVVVCDSQAAFNRILTHLRPNDLQKELRRIYEQAAGIPLTQGVHVRKVGVEEVGPEAAILKLIPNQTEVTIGDIDETGRRAINIFLTKGLKLFLTVHEDYIYPFIEPEMTLEVFLAKYPGSVPGQFQITTKKGVTHEIEGKLEKDVIKYLNNNPHNIPDDAIKEIFDFFLSFYSYTGPVVRVSQLEILHNIVGNVGYSVFCKAYWINWLGVALGVFGKEDYTFDSGSSEADLKDTIRDMLPLIKTEISQDFPGYLHGYKS